MTVIPKSYWNIQTVRIPFILSCNIFIEHIVSKHNFSLTSVVNLLRFMLHRQYLNQKWFNRIIIQKMFMHLTWSTYERARKEIEWLSWLRGLFVLNVR